MKYNSLKKPREGRADELHQKGDEQPLYKTIDLRLEC